MTLVRRNIWSLSTERRPWHRSVVAYARAVTAMQALPEADPRSWRYQAAIHGRSGVTPPRGAPWSECQHGSWYFLPWHRMYLFHFEQIVRSFVDAAGGPADWTLPYWDYSRGAPGHALPPAFRTPTLPDGSANPLLVARRRPSVNAGTPLPAAVVNTSTALSRNVFTSAGAAVGFGGPQTGWAHQGPAFGAVEAVPHGPVHVQVGGTGGLMTDPDLAALDPIFWLHHANIDRLWDLWRLQPPSPINPTSSAWLNRRFSLRDRNGAAVSMRVSEVVDAVAQLDYTYDSLPAGLAVRRSPEEAPVPRRRQPVMIGRNRASLRVGTTGGAADVAVEALPEPAAAAGPGPRLYLNLADIDGRKNPGVVYGVYVNLPPEAAGAEREQHLAGVVSFFGLEQAGPAGAGPKGREAHPLRYSFDVTELMGRLRSSDGWNPKKLRVALLPLEGSEPEGAAAATTRPVRVGTISLHAG